MKNLIRDTMLQVELINAMNLPKREYLHDYSWNVNACMTKEIFDLDVLRIQAIDAILEDCL